MIIAHPLGIIQGVDHLFTGKVERVDTDLLQRCWRRESCRSFRRWDSTAMARPIA